MKKKGTKKLKPGMKKALRLLGKLNGVGLVGFPDQSPRERHESGFMGIVGDPQPAKKAS